MELRKTEPLAVIAGPAWFIDWSSTTNKLSSDTRGPLKAALASLDCEVKGGGRGPQGQALPKYALISGSVENLSEEPLNLSVRIDYVWKGRKFVGKRVESVNPNPLPHEETGWFEFKEYVEFPGDTECMVQFFEDGDEEPIPLKIEHRKLVSPFRQSRVFEIDFEYTQSGNVCFGSFAAGPCPTLSTSALAHKGDIPSDETIKLVSSGGGQAGQR